MQQIEAAPKTIRSLIIATSIISILSPLFSFVMLHFFHTLGSQEFLPLTLTGVEKGWVWQFVSYLFIQTVGVHVSLSLFLSLFFLMFLLWFAGKEIVMRFGPTRFLLLYFTSGIIAALVSFGFLYLANDPAAVVGSGSSVFATLVVWAMLYADLELYYFFIIRIKAKILVGVIFLIPLIMHLITGSFALFFNELTGIIVGYIFGLTLFRLQPLFSIKMPWKKHSKIVDIRSIDEEDDAFMDRMLSKIARHGQNTLTPRERKRMDAISKKKR